MSTTTRILSGLTLLTLVAACGNRNTETVYADPAPMPMVQPEPTYSKY